MGSTASVDHGSPTEDAANHDVSGYCEEVVADSTLDHLVPAEERHEPDALPNTGAPLTLIAAQSSSTLTIDLFMLDTEQLWKPIVLETA